MPSDARVAGPAQPGLPLTLVHRGPGDGNPPGPPATGAPRARRRAPRAAVLLMLGAAGAAGVAGAGWLALGRGGAGGEAPAADAGRLPEGTVAARPPPGVVVGLGKLVPRGRVVTVAAPFGAGDARVASLPVAEGERVAAGDVLATLDSEPTLRAAVAEAEAEVASREAALAQARVAAASARDEARAALARAEAAIEASRRDLDRVAALAGRGASSEQALDQRRAAYRQAVQDAAAARAALLRYDVPDMGRQVDVLVASRAVDAARAALGRALAELGKALVRAPFAGTVLTVHARPGERPGDAGIMTFAALDDMVAEVEVYENHLRGLAPGVPATVTAAALGAPLRGRVSRVGAEILRQTLVDASPAANTDTRVARVEVDLDDASSAAAARFPNLQVTARFQPGDAP